MEARTELKQKIETSTNLAQFIVDCVLEKKAKEPIQLDVREIPEAIFDYFIVCHGTSTTQVKAIADFVAFKMKENFDERPISHEGIKNAEWVLVDYGSVVLHVFLKDKRDFYHLENMWGDAKITKFSDEGEVIAQ